jgi:periplasmic divalent cation tolerance protein
MAQPDPHAVSIYVTCSDAPAAGRIAELLVEERLAACVNMLPGATSVYRWEGRVERSTETVLFIKTRRALAEQVCARVKQLHPDDVACALVLPILGGNPDYLDWLVGEASAAPSRPPPASPG